MLNSQISMCGSQDDRCNIIVDFPKLVTAGSVSKLVASIDLSMVKAKIMDAEEGQGWTREFADLAEQRYRRYLYMVCMNPNGSVVPTRDIDLFWHQHILDTRAYARDCNILFGEFLHHYPYFGMNGEQDAQDLLDSFEETKATWESLFGEPYCVEHPVVQASRCHKGTSTCHKCSSKPGPDTIKCTRCKSK